MNILSYLAQFFSDSGMFQKKKKAAEKIKTHIVFGNFFFENRTVYEIMRKIW
jgi:hypothetical protein